RRPAASAPATARPPCARRPTPSPRSGRWTRSASTAGSRSPERTAPVREAGRLHRVHRDLADPALRRLTMAAIAACWGLHDPTHLSRALKAESGKTPSEVRRLAQAGHGHV